jgi:hypothetical protein
VPLPRSESIFLQAQLSESVITLMQKRYGFRLRSSQLSVSFQAAPELIITRISTNLERRVTIPRKTVTAPLKRRNMIRTLPPLEVSLAKEGSLLLTNETCIPAPLQIRKRQEAGWDLMQEDV